MSSSGPDEKNSSPVNPTDQAPNPIPNPTETPPHPSPSRRRQNENPMMNTSPQRPRPMLPPPRPQPVLTSELRTLFPPRWTPLWQTFPGLPPIVYSGKYSPSPFYFPHGIAPPPVPVGASSSGVGSGVVVRQGSPRAKNTALPGRGKDAPAPSGPPVHCSVCNKVFNSQKALFGHMRSHPDRGWKGAHPPPKFNAEEEFADMPGVDLQALAEAVGAAEGDQGTGGGGGEGENSATAGGIGEGEVVREAHVGEIVEEVAAEGQQEEGAVEQQQVAEPVVEPAAREVEQQKAAEPVVEPAEAVEAEQQQEAEHMAEPERIYRIPDLNETPTSENE